MKLRFLLTVAGALALGLPARAQTPADVLITVDEFGNGTGTLLVPGGVPRTDPLPSGLFDITGTGITPTLNYELPPGITFVPGFVGISEPHGLFSDIIQFTTFGGAPIMVFFSDQDGGIDAPADLAGLPTDINFGAETPEVALGGSMYGADYTPAPGEPGFITSAPTPLAAHYRFISDTVPEPGALAMLAGIGVSGSALGYRRRRRR